MSVDVSLPIIVNSSRPVRRPRGLSVVTLGMQRWFSYFLRCRFDRPLPALLVWSVLTIGTYAEDAVQSITYEQHVRPIFVEHCAICHSLQKKRAGLALDDYAALVEGGASGPVVVRGDPDSSRLWNLVSHEEEPAMPPDQDRISDDKLALIRQWIEMGILQRKGDKPVATTGTALSFDTAQSLTAERIMPQDAVRQPVPGARRAGAVASIDCAPAAPLVAITQAQQVLLYHIDDGELLAVLPGGDILTEIQVVRFSHDGRLLLAAGGRHGQHGKAVIFDVATCQPLAVVGEEIDMAMAADLHPSSQWVALGGPQRQLHVYEVATSSVQYVANAHTDWSLAASFSPDGQLLASADRAGGLYLWEAASGYEFRSITTHTKAVTALSWRSDSKVLASASEDGTVRLWEIPSANSLRSVNAHPTGVLTVRFLADGRVVTAGRDRMVKLWSTALQPEGEYGPLPDVVLSAAVSADGNHLIAGDWQGNVACWTLPTKALGPEFNVFPPTLAQRLEDAEARISEYDGYLAENAHEAGDLRIAREMAIAKRDKLREEIHQFAERESALHLALAESNGRLPQAEAERDMARRLQEQLSQILRVAEQAVADAASASDAMNDVVTLRDDVQARLARQVQRLEQAETELQQARQAVVAADLAARFFSAAYHPDTISDAGVTDD